MSLLRRRLTPALAVLLLLATSLSVGAPAAVAATGCTSGVPGDVNGDGHAEVVVGEKGARDSAGAVHVFYGHRSGLVVKRTGTARDDQYFSQDSPGVPDQGQPAYEDFGGEFGSDTILGDFDGDGCSDLAVSAPGQDYGLGSVTVLYGSPSGIHTARAQLFTSATLAMPRLLGVAALAVADLDDDGVDDLAIGSGASSTEWTDLSGAVAVVYGDRAGLNRGSTPADFLTEDSPGVPGTAEDYDRFGEGLTTGDFDGDGRSELVVGVPIKSERGVLQVLERGPGGFDQPQPAPLGLSAAGVPDDAQRYSFLGGVLAAGDLNGDGRDDLATGMVSRYCLSDCDSYPSDGQVVVFPGSAAGLTGTGSQLWTQDSPGVHGQATSEGFGSSLATGRLDGDSIDDLAIGAFNDTVASAENAGSVTLLLGSTGGLTTRGQGGSRFTEATPGVVGRAGDGFFGASLTTAYVQSPTQASLVVGVPIKDIGGVFNAGCVHQLAMGGTGPTGTGSRTFSAATRGVKGRSAQQNEFGRSLG